jgi:MoaA/NifB/PqqE/SkfB family radical SAM enzyme
MAALKPSMMRMQAIDDGVLRIGPQTVHLDVTNSCNTDCVTCWDHSPHLTAPRPAAWKRQRADIRQLMHVVDDIETLGGLEAVIVSGMGEPFTHPDIYLLLEDLKRRGLHVTVITNLVAADIERVIEIGVDALLVGVQGASEDSYLAFHPSFGPQHWHTLQAQLAALRDAPGVEVKQVQVVCAHNAHELTRMVEQAALFKARQVNFKLASLKEGTEAARITEAQRHQLVTCAIEEARILAASLNVVTNLDMFERQVRAGGELTAPIDEVGCFIGTSYSRITVDGTVLFCCNTEVVVGQLPPHPQGKPFSALWRSAAWDGWRQRMREGRYLASCFQCGKVNQNEKLSRRFRELFGEARWLQVTGRGPAARPRPFARASRASLPVLP